MIAIDTNILVYAHRNDSPFHAQAAGQLRELAESGALWSIFWPCLHEFLAIVTHPKIYLPPTPLANAIEQVEVWRASPAFVLIGEGEGYWEELQETMRAAHALGPRVHDARIAALCHYHGVHELWTADRDFSRFGNVKVRNPLV